MKSVMKKRYSAEFRAQAVELVRLGKPVAVVAEDLCIGTSVLYRWLGANLKLENDILKKAAVILGTNPQRPSAR
jgi:transposase